MQFIIPDTCHSLPGCAWGGSITLPPFLGYWSWPPWPWCEAAAAGVLPSHETQDRAREMWWHWHCQLHPGFPVMCPLAEAAACSRQVLESPASRFCCSILPAKVGHPHNASYRACFACAYGYFIKTLIHLPGAFTSPSPIPLLLRLQKRFWVYF